MGYFFEPLIPARLEFRADGIPFSERYGDIYHAEMGALAQAEYVFMQGNQLPERWRGRDTFTICETGFGLGQNFLAAWHAWRSDPSRSRCLHMVSFEAHPFSRADMQRVLLGSLPASIKALAAQLLAVWPPLLPGLHRLEFEGGAVTLTLAFGPIKHFSRQVEAAVDAFFLDGFSPRKNPEMWTRSLFGQLVRMANAGATLATWCSVGEVRRSLADAGFLVSRSPGFGSKRAMTVAVLRSHMGRTWPIAPPSDSVLIVGGGLAGAGIAHSLALRGLPSIVVDPVFANGLGASHQGHRAAALTPLISKDDDIRARLSRAGTLRALHRWQSLPLPARPVRCGTLELASDEDDALQRRNVLGALSFPSEWVSWLDKRQASEQAGFKVKYGGVYFSYGQLVQPAPLIQALLSRPEVSCLDRRVATLERVSTGQWLAKDSFGARVALASTVVLANAAQAKTLLSGMPCLNDFPALAGMQNIAGQVSYFSSAASGLNSKHVLAGEGYWLPAVNYVSVGGSTYVPDATNSVVTDQGNRAVVAKVAVLLNVHPAEAEKWLDASGGWAGWRAVASGRLPVIGQLGHASGLWLACAYGSRGLTWSALAGDVISARLCQEPAILERELLKSVAPR
ncbi:MAG TPA: FAD-dependent 5-carboxymethylaminomethyl-2-thiouridine(34) oxidoreductase MnmC [Eoetvoesiella sp.]